MGKANERAVVPAATDDDVFIPRRLVRRRDRFNTPFAPDVQVVRQRDEFRRKKRKHQTPAAAAGEHAAAAVPNAMFSSRGFSMHAAATSAANDERQKKKPKDAQRLKPTLENNFGVAPAAAKREGVVGTLQSWDGEWTVAAAAAAEMEGTLSEPSEVLAAHLSSGWKLRAPRGGGGAAKKPEDMDSWDLMLEAPALPDIRKRRGSSGDDGDGGASKADDVPRAAVADTTESAADGLQPLRFAYGLVRPPVPPPPPPPRPPRPHEVEAAQAAAAGAAVVAEALCQLCGAVSAARLCGRV